MPGNLQTENNVSTPPTIVVSLTTTPPHFLSLCLWIMSRIAIVMSCISISEYYPENLSCPTRDISKGIHEQLSVGK
jgi:hypothetical protein